MRRRRYRVTMLCGSGYHGRTGAVGRALHIVPTENFGSGPALCGRTPGLWSHGWDEAVFFGDLRALADEVCRACRKRVRFEPAHGVVENASARH